MDLEIRISETSITKPEKGFVCHIIDIDDPNSSLVMADGSNTRDRITTKRELDMSFGALSWSNMSKILNLLKEPFFTVYYPDIETGGYETKTFSVKDKSAPYAVGHKDELYWDGLSIKLIEK